MTSRPLDTVFVWTWLPGAVEPVVAGRLDMSGVHVSFTYGRSFQERPDAIPLYLPELPLRPGRIDPMGGLSMPGIIRDAAPDAWGQRVIEHRVFGGGAEADASQALSVLDYLVSSGSDRIGALDFQRSASVYEPRTTAAAPLEALLDAAERVERGLALDPAIDDALLHGTSVGGARPKVLVSSEGRSSIAKLSSTTDTYAVVQGEYVAMRLASLVGLDVAPVEHVTIAGRHVLLVDRFDRTWDGAGWHRHGVVSALTMLGLDPIAGRYASYSELAGVIRTRFEQPRAALREMFARLVFNVLVGNTDDHARNHAALWDGSQLTLAPAYDICPLPRLGRETRQAMALTADGRRDSRLVTCRAAASSFLVDDADAASIIDHQIETIRSRWSEVCDEAELTSVERAAYWQTAFLNPYAFEDG